MRKRNMGVPIKMDEDARVYGGDCDLIHVQDGQRGKMGEAAARYIDMSMRHEAWKARARTRNEVETQSLCPGCYMVVGFNALLTLAKQNGQSLPELGRTMAAAFTKLAECGDDAACIEEINVLLDPEG